MGPRRFSAPEGSEFNRGGEVVRRLMPLRISREAFLSETILDLIGLKKSFEESVHQTSVTSERPDGSAAYLGSSLRSLT